MTRLHHVLAVAPIAVLCGGALATGASSAAMKVGPVKGATYSGDVHDTPVTIRVSANGKRATAEMARLPGYCQGGSGPETPHFKAGSINKGAFKETLSYTGTGSSKPFGSAVIQGTFIGKDFDGVEKSTFKAASACDGQASFLATTSK